MKKIKNVEKGEEIYFFRPIYIDSWVLIGNMVTIQKNSGGSGADRPSIRLSAHAEGFTNRRLG
jgi:hypothetical protein